MFVVIHESLFDRTAQDETVSHVYGPYTKKEAWELANGISLDSCLEWNGELWYDDAEGAETVRVEELKRIEK
jgi:hypothetical protein